MIILPEQEEILDFVCGDKEFWVVSGAQNLAYIKPAKAGATTNLNLVTASGHVYSFVLTEGSADPDLKVFVRLDDSMKAPKAGPQKFYSAAQVDELRRDAEDARKEADDARKQVDAVRERPPRRSTNASTSSERRFRPRCSSRIASRRTSKPFNVSAIYTDGRFTYIRSDATELPALYEMVDGWPRRSSRQVW